MRKIISILFTYFCIVSASNADNLIVGVESTQYFPQYQYENGEYKGYARELLDLFAKHNGHSLTYTALPVKRLLDAFLDSEIDLKYPDNKYWASDLKAKHAVNYSDAAVDYIDGTLVLPENLGQGVDKLKRLGTLRGFTAFDYFPHIEAGTVSIKENNNLESLIKQLQNKRIDGVYFNVNVAYYYLLNDQSSDKPVFDASLPHTKSSYTLSSIKRPDVIKQFNAFLVSHADEVAALKTKYKVEEGF